MLDYIDKLRKKPEQERRRAVFRISLCITLAIAAIWAVVVAMRMSATDFSFVDKSPRRDTPSLRQTFAAFGAEVGRIFKSAEALQEAASSTYASLDASATASESSSSFGTVATSAPAVTSEEIPSR